MTNPMSARETLDREFLAVRADLLRIAASLDRMDRGSGDVVDDPRRTQLLDAIKLLASPEDGRAEKLQLLFSLSYDEDWVSKFGLHGQSAGTGQGE